MPHICAIFWRYYCAVIGKLNLKWMCIVQWYVMCYQTS